MTKAKRGRAIGMLEAGYSRQANRLGLTLMYEGAPVHRANIMQLCQYINTDKCD